MNKRGKIELIITGILLLAEVMTIILCYSEALQALNTDIYLTAVITIFINIDIFYLIILLIINTNFKDK